jgi:hypothetical protein
MRGSRPRMTNFLKRPLLPLTAVDARIKSAQTYAGRGQKVDSILQHTIHRA